MRITKKETFNTCNPSMLKLVEPLLTNILCYNTQLS